MQLSRLDAQRDILCDQRDTVHREPCLLGP
jgi:hypothetical protein